MQDQLKTSIQYIKGIGPKLAKTFEKIGLSTVDDILYNFPRIYEDRRKIPRICEAKPDSNMIFVGDVVATKTETTRNRKKIFKAMIDDGSGVISVIWFNQPFLKASIKIGKRLFVSGKVERNNYRGDCELYCSDYEILSLTHKNNISIGRVLPIYNLTKGIQQKKIRTITYDVLSKYLKYVNEYYSADFLANNNLMGLREAIYNLHYPGSGEKYKKAKRRIVFDEFFFMQLVLAQRRYKHKKTEKGIVFDTDSPQYDRYLSSLPYSLTGAQSRVIDEIKDDMAKSHPMNRLVQGDVGSGKTEIAVASIIIAVENGYQAAMMAPTEILAEQHYKKLVKHLEPLGIRVELLVGRLKAKQKREAQELVGSNMVDVVVGTHALVQEKVSIPNLGLAVIDEQHRFGVLQRAALTRHGKSPDLVVMTATPIPRTMTLTIYGDLDKSIIDEMPPGRKEIKTYWIESASRAYEFVREKLNEGQQVYYVLPLVEESEKIDLKAATEVHKHLCEDIYPDFNIGLLHGKMKGDDKDSIMTAFRNKEIDLLVSTTVIEVGVDVPNASVMVIEHAERFGLSQLHQLRGRVGRGSLESFCVLIGKPGGQDGKKRLKVMTQTTNGFKIAEHDLELRGPGDYYGTKQSGLPSMIMADFIKDEPVLLEARKVATLIIDKDYALSLPEHQEILGVLKSRADYVVTQKAMN